VADREPDPGEVSFQVEVAARGGVEQTGVGDRAGAGRGARAGDLVGVVGNRGQDTGGGADGVVGAGGGCEVDEPLAEQGGVGLRGRAGADTPADVQRLGAGALEPVGGDVEPGVYDEGRHSFLLSTLVNRSAPLRRNAAQWR